MQEIKLKVRNDILPMCIEKKWSEASVKSMIAYFGIEEKHGKLFMAILEIDTYVDACIPSSKAVYMEEGGASLIFTSDEILSQLNNQLDNGFGTKNIECVVNEALLLILYQLGR